MKTLISKVLKWGFNFVLRRKLGLKKGPPGENIKPHESEVIWAGVAFTLQALYSLGALVGEQYFGFQLPPIPEWVLIYANAALGGTVVWGRWTSEKKIS